MLTKPIGRPPETKNQLGGNREGAEKIPNHDIKPSYPETRTSTLKTGIHLR